MFLLPTLLYIKGRGRMCGSCSQITWTACLIPIITSCPDPDIRDSSGGSHAEVRVIPVSHARKQQAAFFNCVLSRRNSPGVFLTLLVQRGRLLKKWASCQVLWKMSIYWASWRDVNDWLMMLEFLTLICRGCLFHLPPEKLQLPKLLIMLLL